VAGRWFSPVSFTNKTECHDITEIFLMIEIIDELFKDVQINKLITITYKHVLLDIFSIEIYSS
jgi:hypothetical protein